jgi:hypothetical protein
MKERFWIGKISLLQVSLDPLLIFVAGAEMIQTVMRNLRWELFARLFQKISNLLPPFFRLMKRKMIRTMTEILRLGLPEGFPQPLGSRTKPIAVAKVKGLG